MTPRWPRARHPLDHLVGRLVRERDQQDLAGRDSAGLDRVRRAPADDPRLARAGAGEDHQRPARDVDGFSLGLVQVIEKLVRWSCFLLFHYQRSVAGPRDSCLSQEPRPPPSCRYALRTRNVGGMMRRTPAPRRTAWLRRAIALVSLVVVVSCVSAPPQSSPTPSAEAGAPTVYDRLFERVGSEGEVDLQLAIDAFSLVIAPLPGAAPVEGRRTRAAPACRGHLRSRLDPPAL